MKHPLDPASSAWAARLHAVRFRMLFGSFMGLLALAPIVTFEDHRGILATLFVANFLAVGYASARGRVEFWGLVALAIGAIILASVQPGDGYALGRDLVFAVVYLAFFVSLISHVRRARQITSEEVFAALTGYLFLIMFFTALYRIIALTLPGSFMSAAGPVAQQNTFVYFSIVTQTTLGYGDIQPISPPARMVAGLQAIVGQLYLAVLVARLVALQLLSRADD